MVEASRFTFKKEERICSDKLLNELFSGKAASLSSYPIHCVWMKVEDESCVPAVRVLVSVSKRKFKHAVDRNRVKRQMREAYRLGKHILTDVTEERGCKLVLAFVWIPAFKKRSDEVRLAMNSLLCKVAKSL